LGFNNIAIGNTNVKLDSAIVDSGTSLLIASPDVAAGIKKALGLEANTLEVDCDIISELDDIEF